MFLNVCLIFKVLLQFLHLSPWHELTCVLNVCLLIKVLMQLLHSSSGEVYILLRSSILTCRCLIPSPLVCCSFANLLASLYSTRTVSPSRCFVSSSMTSLIKAVQFGHRRVYGTKSVDGTDLPKPASRNISMSNYFAFGVNI